MIPALRVLVTRPVHQAELLISRLRTAGHLPVAFPTIAIEPLPNGLARDPDTTTPTTCDIAIFSSANAVWCANRINSLTNQLEGVQTVLAIGPATSRALRRVGIHPRSLEGKQFDSEHLLENPELASISGCRVSVYKGQGGRTLITETLRKRGALVEECVVYRRISVGDSNPEHVRRALQNLDVILSGSDEALANLVTLAPKSLHSKLFSVALIVNSERGRLHAETCGFRGRILVARPAGDDGQLNALAQLALQRQ